MSDADADVAASVAQRFNDRMERDGIGWVPVAGRKRRDDFLAKTPRAAQPL
jgi:hypothetical protein